MRSGSGARSAVIASCRPSGEMSKSSADGSHGGSATVEARQQILAVSGAHVARKHVGFASVRHPVIPVARGRALGHVRLHFRVLAFLQPFGLRRVRLQIRPDAGHEGDALAVGKPFQSGRPGGDLRHPLRLAAIGRDAIHLWFGVVLALGGERDPLAVRRPARLAVLVAGGESARPIDGGRSLFRDIAVGEARGEQPQLGARFVGVHRERCDRRARDAAVRRQRRIADALDLPKRRDIERRQSAGTAGASGRHANGLKLE